jgi:hypothetical protein
MALGVRAPWSFMCLLRCYGCILDDSHLPLGSTPLSRVFLGIYVINGASNPLLVAHMVSSIIALWFILMF